MKLLDEIIDLAVDNSSSVSVVLRKCLVLAHTLKNERLKTWVEKELNGYDNGDELPEYRRVETVAKGLFVGPLGPMINDQPLAAFVLEPEHRHFATKARLVQPIAAYEMELGEKDMPCIEWPANLTAMYQRKFIKGFTLSRARQEIPPSAFVGLRDTVRNRIVKFALEIKDELGTVNDDISAIPPTKVEQSVTNNIYGGTNVIAGTAHHFAQIGEVNVTQGDFGSLSTALRQLGVGEQDLGELKKAIGHDNTQQDARSLGQKTGEWVRVAAAKVGASALKIGGNVAEAVITQWLRQYLGLPP
jgi:AbiTii